MHDALMAKILISLDTVDDVIEKLGGAEAVRQVVDVKAPSAVPMWRTRKKFPVYTYKLLQNALRERGMTAPDHLWGMR
jgi:hypothetical protein